LQSEISVPLLVTGQRLSYFSHELYFWLPGMVFDKEEGTVARKMVTVKQALLAFSAFLDSSDKS
jgi:hypothetical protein